MNAGRLSDRVVFQAHGTTGSGESFAVTWTDDFTVWSEVRRDSELIAQFIIRYRSGVTPASHRLIWEGTVWRITSVVHDRRRTMLTINADAEPLVESTDLDSVTTEYIDAVPVLRPRE